MASRRLRPWHLLAGALLLAATAGHAEEGRPTCDLEAVGLGTDARLLRIYDGLRNGLERAHLPRVCQRALDAEEATWTRWTRELEVRRLRAARGDGVPPVAFLFGEDALARAGHRALDVPRVSIGWRYTLGDTPLVKVPPLEGTGAQVVATLGLERVAEVLRQLTGERTPRAALLWRSTPAGAEAVLARIARHAGIAWTRPDGEDEARPHVLLHLRLGLGETLVPVAEAMARGRRLRVPVVGDDPARFRRGQIPVVIATEHALVGRYAAEAARVLLRHGARTLPRRTVRGVRVLVDLQAADDARVAMPLPFLARADVVHRGLGPRAGDEGR